MRTVLVLCTIIFGVSARPSDVTSPVVTFQIPSVSEIVTQYHAQDSAGQYSYSYSNPLSSKAEVRSLDGVTNGAYNYVDPNGKVQTVEYTSDENGFRLRSATNLPESPRVRDLPKLEAPVPVSDTPEVVEARTRHLEALKQAELLTAEQPAKIETAVVRAPPIVVPFELLRFTPNFVLPSSPLLSLNYEIPGASITYATYNAPFLPGFGFQVAGTGAAPTTQTVQAPSSVKEDEDTVTVEAKSADQADQKGESQEKKE